MLIFFEDIEFSRIEPFFLVFYSILPITISYTLQIVEMEETIEKDKILEIIQTINLEK